MKITNKIYSTAENTGCEVTTAEFSLALNTGTYFLLDAYGTRILYPFSDKPTEYRYITANGIEKCFAKSVFFTMRKQEHEYQKRCKDNGKAYHPNFYWFEDIESGLLTMLAPISANKEIVDFNRRERDRVAKQHERDTRCRLDDGKICQQPCAGCERQGERQSIFVSIDLLIESGYRIADNTEVSLEAEGELLLDELQAVLNDDEFRLLVGLSDGHTLRSYATESARITPQSSVNALYQRLYRLKPTAFRKAMRILNAWK